MPDHPSANQAYAARRTSLINRRTLLNAQRRPLSSSPGQPRGVIDERLASTLLTLDTIDELLRLSPDESRIYWDHEAVLVCPRGCQTVQSPSRDPFGWTTLADCGTCGSPLTLASRE